MESGEKREILNGSECLTGEGKGRSTSVGSEKFEGREQRVVSKEGELSRRGKKGDASSLFILRIPTKFRIVDDFARVG